MHIYRNPKNQVAFNTLMEGDVFDAYADCTFMKTKSISTTIANQVTSVNAVEVSTGQFYHFNDTDKVAPVKCVLNIED